VLYPDPAEPGIRLDIRAAIGILKSVLNHSGEVDAVFTALADPTRRQIVEQLGRGPASVSELAKPLPISLPAVVQHLQVLEASGLVRSEKVGRVRTCRLEVKRLDTVQDWIEARRRTWERRLDRLGDYLAATPEDPTPKGKKT
jgi:DNA-binding transcriptional ArsR family regulator